MANAEPRSLLAQSLSPWPSAAAAIWNLPSGDDQEPEESCITVPFSRCWYPLTDLLKAMKAIRTPEKAGARQRGRCRPLAAAGARSPTAWGKKGMPWHALRKNFLCRSSSWKPLRLRAQRALFMLLDAGVRVNALHTAADPDAPYRAGIKIVNALGELDVVRGLGQLVADIER